LAERCREDKPVYTGIPENDLSTTQEEMRQKENGPWKTDLKERFPEIR
jgi:hypothetical protein